MISDRQLKAGKMLEYFHPDALEQKYGGKMPNIVNFFPPDFSKSGEELLTKKQVLEYKKKWMILKNLRTFENNVKFLTRCLSSKEAFS